MTGTRSRRRIKGAFEGAERQQIKVALLDQSRIAGIGNIYASEILHRIGVNPQMLVRDFTKWSSLGQTTYRVLAGAVAGQGTRIKGANPHRTPNDDEVNGFTILAYGKTDQPCVGCNAPIKQFTQAGRSTYWCPECQQ